MRDNRTPLAALAALACINFLVRYPTTSHEIGVDSFVWHGMATSLQQRGVALWVLNPLSYLGLYPLSHPSGSPFLLAAFSALWGGPIEGSVLFIDMTIALLAMLAAFILGWEFTRSRVFALFMSMVLSLTPEMITALTWQVPTRIFFTVLLPLFLWALIRLARRPGRSIIIPLAMMFLLMMSFHRLTVLVSLIGIAYVITGISLALVRTLRLWSPQIFLRRGFLRWAPVSAVAAVGIVSIGTMLSTNVLDQYSSGVLASGNSPAIQSLNLGISLARNSGLLLPFALPGIAGVAMQRNKGYAEPFVIVALLAFLPMLFLRQYTGYYTVPFTSLFITFGLFVVWRRVKSLKRRGAVILGAAILVIVTSIAISGYDIALVSHISNDTYSTALFVHYATDGTVITNEGLLGSRIHAISGAPYLPVGGATTTFQSPELLMFGFVDSSTVQRDIVPVPLHKLTVDSDSFFALPSIQAEGDWATMLASDVASMTATHVRYRVTYFLEAKWIRGMYTAYGNFYPSVLGVSVDSGRYVLYEDASVRLFYIGG